MNRCGALFYLLSQFCGFNVLFKNKQFEQYNGVRDGGGSYAALTCVVAALLQQPVADI